MKHRQKFFLLIVAVLIFSSCRTNLPVSYEEKGDRAFSEQHYGKALSHWRKSAEEAKNSQIFHKIGRVCLLLSDLDGAEEYFKKALQIDPGISEIRKDLIRTMLLKGNREGALKHLGEIEKGSGKDSDYYILSGDTRMISGDFSEAYNMYGLALKQDAERPRSRIKAAICMARIGDKDGAGTMIDALRKKESLSPQNLTLLADYFFLLRDYVRAEHFMVQAAEKDPSDIAIQMDLCRFYLETGMRDKAKEILIQLQSRYPENNHFLIMLIDFYISEKDMEKAEVYLKKAEEKQVDGSELALLRGKFWLFNGKLPYAVSALKSAVENNPKLISGYFLLGIGYFAGGQTKLAENSFIRALLLNPDHVETLLALAGLHYKNQDYDLAVQYLERVLLLDPLNPRGYTLKGVCLLAQDENEDAADLFSKAWALGENPAALFLLGRSLENQKKYDSALELYERVIEEKSKIPSVLFRYSSLLLELGQGVRALKKTDEILATIKHQNEILYIGAWLSLKLEKVENAILYLNKALNNQERVSGPFYTLLAAVQEKAGNPDLTEQALKKCMKINPSYKQAWIRMADFYLQRNSLEPALEVLNQAVEKFPEDPEITGNLAWTYLEAGVELDRALDLARKAYEKLPGEAWLMDTLGWAYFHKQAYTQAEWILSEAEHNAPEKGVLKYHLGMVFYRQGKLFKAREMLTAALDTADLPIHNKEDIETILTEMNPVKEQDAFNTNIILDPENTFSLPRDSEEENDILEPDWSNFK